MISRACGNPVIKMWVVDKRKTRSTKNILFLMKRKSTIALFFLFLVTKGNPHFRKDPITKVEHSN